MDAPLHHKALFIITLQIATILYLSHDCQARGPAVAPLAIQSLSSIPAQNKQALQPPASLQQLNNKKMPIPSLAKKNTPIKTKVVSGKHEIPVNASLPLKGEIAILSSQISDGMSLFFNKLKKEINKIPFTYNLEVLDDNGDPIIVKEKVKQLTPRSPLFLSFLDAETLTAAASAINNQDILALFPIDGSLLYRKPHYKNILFFRASYEQEIEALIYYSIRELNKKKIAIFYEASDWGEGALSILKKTLKKYGLDPVAQASYPQKTLNVTKAGEAIASQSPNAIICIAQARPAYNFIKQIINKGLDDTKFFGLSSLASIQKTLKKSRGIHLITTSVVPDPAKSKIAIVQEYRLAMKKYSPNKPLSTSSLEGYINAALLVECTKLLPRPFTMTNLIDAIATLKNVRFKGLELTFNPETRTLSHQVWLNTEDEKEWPLAKVQ